MKSQEPPKPLPESVAKRLVYLRKSEDPHHELLGKILSADGGKAFGVDFLVVAVINRSLKLIDGFATLVERRNMICAVPLIRLQIDSLMRLYACWLVDEPHSVAIAFLNDKPLKGLKSNEGKTLTDAYLHTKLAEHYPWVSRVYEAVSGFVHLSKPIIFAPFVADSLDKDELSVSIAVPDGREWREEEMLEAVDAFIEATKSLLHLCASWLVTKETVAKEREREDSG